jgi:hypothetical protein
LLHGSAEEDHMIMLRSRGLSRAIAVGMVAGSLSMATTATALAAPGDWTQLSSFPAATDLPKTGILDEPTAARFGSMLQVVWSGQGTSGGNYYTASVDGAGHISAPAHEIISNWAAIISNPVLISLNGQRFLGFSGLQSTTTGAPYTVGAEYYATSSDGQAFALGAGSLSAAGTAYAGYGNDIVDNAGTPVWVGNAGTTSGVSWHSGIAGTDPAPPGSDGYFGLTGCCAYAAAGTRDASNGAVYAAFYSNANGSAEKGIQVGQILPAQGAFSQAPGSATTNDYGTNSISPTQRVAMAARAGGGVYVAYGIGYPTVTAVRIWQVGTPRFMDVPGSGDAAAISLAADPAGRLWVTFGQKDRIKVVHTNTSATALGTVGSWGAPRGTVDLWKTTTSAAAGSLDVIVTANGSNSKVNVWHTQVTRTLTVKASPASVARGHSVTFTVTDAGDAVSGAQVRFGGRTATTNGAGKASINAPGSGGRATATARKSGYNDGKATVRVH